MLANERQNRILQMLEAENAVTTADLAERFSVSLESIRRDFLLLEEAGLLQRVHGGAVSANRVKPFLSLKERICEYRAEKDALSAVAARYIEEKDIIGIDSGSTALSFAEALAENFTQLTVITHSSDVFSLLCHHKNFKVILCGGRFYQDEHAFYGPITLDTINKLHIQKMFLFPSAVSLQYGISDYNENAILVQRAYLSNSSNIFVLADSSKFEKHALLKIADMLPQYTYITDAALSPHLAELYNENNIKIITATED